MAITYATNAISFINSITGTGTNKNIKSLVPVQYDRLFHKQVQDLIFWRRKGLIGEDTFSEGGVTETAPGMPVIRKTELGRNPGDHIVMGQLRNLTVDPYNASNVGGGVTGGTQLVDAEQSWDFYHKKVQLERQREGARTDNGMNKKRNPYKSFEEIEAELLSDWYEQTFDTAGFFAFHFGQAPHFFRQMTTDAAVDGYDLAATPSAELRARSNPNLLVGHDSAMTTYATTALAQTQMNTSDTDFATWRANNKISPTTFEIISAFARKNKWDMINVNGKSYIVAVISPQQELALRTNADFRQAAFYAQQRGEETNWIFRHADYVFADVLVFVHNAVNDVIGVRRADQLTGNYVSATSTKISLGTTAYVDDAAATVANKMCPVLFMGANALALAESDMSLEQRSENDYKNIVARGVDTIYNWTRMDWLSETGPGTTVENKSSGEILVGI